MAPSPPRCPLRPHQPLRASSNVLGTLPSQGGGTCCSFGWHALPPGLCMSSPFLQLQLFMQNYLFSDVLPGLGHVLLLRFRSLLL